MMVRMRHGLAMLWAALAMAGCGMPASGVTFRGSLAVAEALEEGRPLPGYTYYYSGPEHYPLAILGVRPEFRLRQGFWKPVELTPAHLRGWMEVINNRTRSPRSQYQGSIIRDGDGMEIGIWYSPLDWSPVRLGPGNEVAIDTPSNTLFDAVSDERPVSPFHRRRP
ncbi:MAG: hypothetical protein ACOY3Z_05390 [Thermodesulfobacteriota bacterium]